MAELQSARSKSLHLTWLGTANHFSHEIPYLVFPVDDLKFCGQFMVVYHFCGLKGFLKVSSMVQNRV